MLWQALFGGGFVDLILNIVALTIVMGLLYVAITRGVQDGILRADERQERRAAKAAGEEKTPAER